MLKHCRSFVLLALLTVMLSAFPSTLFAATSGDIAFSDADEIWEKVISIKNMTTLRQFELRFDKPSEPYNLGANMYRNCDWKFPLVSADASLDMHVGFNYDKRAEWSMSIDFGEDAASEKRYFVALCRGFEKITGHTSQIIRFEPMRADTSVNAYYPMPDGTLLSVSSSDDDSFGTILLAPVPAGTDSVFTIRTTADDVPMYAAPDEKTDVVRRLRKNYSVISLETRAYADTKSIWHKVRDGDGEIGWIQSSNATPVGIFGLGNAFEKIK